MFIRLSECGLLHRCVGSPWCHGTGRSLATGGGGASSHLWDVHHRQRSGHSPACRGHRRLPQHHSQKVTHLPARYCVSLQCDIVWMCVCVMFLLPPPPPPPGLKAVRASTSQPAAASSLQLASHSPSSLFATQQSTPHRSKFLHLTFPPHDAGSATIICGPVKCGSIDPDGQPSAGPASVKRYFPFFLIDISRPCKKKIHEIRKLNAHTSVGCDSTLKWSYFHVAFDKEAKITTKDWTCYFFLLLIPSCCFLSCFSWSVTQCWCDLIFGGNKKSIIILRGY